MVTAPDVKSEPLAEAARVVTSLRSDIEALVERVEVESVDRIRLRLTGGRTVMWGSAEDSAQKAEVLAVLLKRDAREIDVSVPGRPTTR
jgi:cell division protein FtsQ